jgi:hypothetical protein
MGRHLSPIEDRLHRGQSKSEAKSHVNSRCHVPQQLVECLAALKEMNLTRSFSRLSLPAMSGRLFKLPVVLALMVSIGLHWALLQSVAWVGMVVRYAQNDSFSSAIEKTFDGKHPCALCRIVAEGQKAEKKQDVKKPGPKFELFIALGSEITFPPASVSLMPLSADSPSAPSGAPPLPPPRIA